MATCSSPKVLASGYSEGLFVHSFDSKSGKLGQANKTEADANLSFSAYDKDSKNLYAVHEVKHLDKVKEPKEKKDSDGKTGAVSRWQLDDNQVFQRKEVFPSGGTEPAHVALDAARRLLYVTNYGGGSINIFRLAEADGAIVHPPIYTETFKEGSKVDKERQEAPHLHGTFLYKDLAYVVDLGSDKIYAYKVKDNGATVGKAENFETAVAAGAGPRHLAMDEKRGRAYLINELKNVLDVYDVDGDSGKLTLAHSMEYTIPFGKEGTRQYGAGIAVHPNGKFLYVSNRGDGAIVAFSLPEDGAKCPKQLEAVESGGTWPRHFAISEDGEHMLVADQFKHVITTFKIDKETGKISKSHEIKSGDSPSMVLFF